MRYWSPLVQFRHFHINLAHGVVGCHLKHGRVCKKTAPRLALSSNPVNIVLSNAAKDPKVVVKVRGSLNIKVKKSRTEDTKSEASVSFISYHLEIYFYI